MELFNSNSYDGLGESKGASTGYGRVEIWQGQAINNAENRYYGGHVIHYYGKGFGSYIIEKPFSGYVAYYPLSISEGKTSGVPLYNSNLTYAKYNDEVFNGPFPYFSVTPKNWTDGILEKEEYFSDKNELVKQTHYFNSYDINSKIIGEGLKVSSNPYLLYKKEGTTDPVQPLTNNAFFRKYEIISNRISLDSIVITEFLNGKALSRIIRYEYDPAYHMIKSTQETTPLSIKKTSIKYPFDYKTTICDTMTKHRLFYPIEKIEKMNEHSVKGEKYDYEFGAFNTKLNRNLINLSANYSWATNQWNKKNTFDYNAEGDVIEINSKGLVSSYLWGSNKYCPVASAIGIGANLLNSQLQKTGYENKIDTLVKRVGNLESESQRLLYTQFNRDLRSKLDKEVQLETYTYEPLWGLTSKTDSRSRTTRYEYDGFSHLNAVRNNEENYVEQFGYRYYNDARPEYEAPILSVSPTSLYFSSALGLQQAAVTSNTTWSASAGSSWLSCSKSGSTLSVGVSANSSSSSRTGQVVISGDGIASPTTITVTQAGAPAAPYLNITPSSFRALSGGRTGLLGKVEVTSNVCWSIKYDQMRGPKPYVVAQRFGNEITGGCGSMQIDIYQHEGLDAATPSAVILKTTEGSLQKTISIGRFIDDL